LANPKHNHIGYRSLKGTLDILLSLDVFLALVNIFAATANPVTVLIAEDEQGRGILGVIDGFKSKGIETEENIRERKEYRIPAGETLFNATSASLKTPLIK
jgi:adenosine/AMP kinase